ncbi:MAG TPA: UdgX family uracil-DNA binding protein, partial [Gaiellaceae bacterium]
MTATRNPYPTATAFMPERLSMQALREAVQHCKGCPLYANATQAVFGEGTKTSEVMLVGEQPGDQEDLAGAPFVGPAGKLLDRALEEAGIDRKKTYVTNAVKHFKWKARGKRRIHDKPTWTEVTACRPWLDAEIAIVKPRAL